MPTQATLIDDVKAVVQDTTFSSDKILDYLNEGVRYIAGGVELVYPAGLQTFSLPLPDLATEDSSLETSPANAYIYMPTDYQRDLFHLTSTTNELEIMIYGSFAELLQYYPNLDNTSRVVAASVRGIRLYYQGSPTTAESLTAYYYREPTDMAEYSADTISFANTASRIADSADGLSDFTEGQKIDVTGSGTSANNTKYTITAVASDYSYLTVTPAPTTVGAGDTITIKSRPHGIPESLHEGLLVNYAGSRIFRRKAIHDSVFWEPSERLRKEFMRSMLSLNESIEMLREPVIFKNDAFYS